MPEQLKDLISKDVWNVIKDNYERKSYTSSITNLIQFINELVQDKANLENVDNTSLIEQAFFGKSPCLAINKLQTRTEKDIQEGIGHLLKGACLAIRNPRSHDRYEDDKITADRIIMFYDYVLNFIRKSEQPNMVEDWLEFIFDKDFPCDEKYAKEVLKQIPKKKKYDLLINIFRHRERAGLNKLNNIVYELISEIDYEEYKEFMSGINKDLLKSNNDDKLKIFFNLFPPSKWREIENLAKWRVENIVMTSVKNAHMEYEEDFDSFYSYVSTEAMLAAVAIDFIDFFDTKDEIVKIINNRLNEKKDLYNEYFSKYFSKYINVKKIEIGDISDFEEILEDDGVPF